METRAVPAISLKQSNVFGGYSFLSLETLRVIHSQKWLVQPITDNIIELIHEAAERQHQPHMPEKCPIFELETGTTLNLEIDDDVSVGDEGSLLNNEVMELRMDGAIVSDGDDTLIDEDEISEQSGGERLDDGEINIMERGIMRENIYNDSENDEVYRIPVEDFSFNIDDANETSSVNEDNVKLGETDEHTHDSIDTDNETSSDDEHTDGNFELF